MTETSAKDPAQLREIGDYFALLKPRVMSLVVFTAAVGLFVAPVKTDLILAFSSILFIALGAGASGALNMWWDADIDQVMRRTKSRPIPAGKATPNEALMLGLWLSVLSVGMLGLVSNWWAAGFLAFTIFFYAVIYTMWLKRSTPQNIVIGGAAGAFPPMIGWMAVTGAVSVESIAMFLLIFLWTPPHFWALALFVTDDYSNAGVPMLNVTHGRKTTRRHIFIYSLILAPVALGLAFTSIGGPIYFAAALILTLLFVKDAFVIFQRSDEDSTHDNHKTERHLFKLSLYYLFLLFAALAVEAALPSSLYLPFTWPEVI